MPSRRTFLIAGVVGAAGLATVAWWRRTSVTGAGSRAALGADGEAILTAIVPVMLDGALPNASDERQRAIAETLDNLERAVTG